METRMASLPEPCRERLLSFIAEFEARARQTPERVAVVDGSAQVSYSQLNAYADLLAGEIERAGCGRNAMVGIYARRSIRTIGAILATLKAGCTYVPMDPAYPRERLAYISGDAGTRLVFADPDLLDVPAKVDAAVVILEHIDERAQRAAPPRPSRAPNPSMPDPADVAYIIYTSGTTGQPKGAELRHRNIYDNTVAGAELWGADSARPDTYLCVLPLFHSFGQTVIQNGAIAFGGTIVMLPRF